MTLPLPLDRFAALVDAHGADLRRWPPAERDAAQALLRISPEARALRDAAGRLDAMLDRWRVPAHSTDLRLRVLRDAPRAGERRPSMPRRLWHELGGWRLAAPALAAALTLGIGIGSTWPALEPDDAFETELFSLAQLDDPYTEYAP